MKSVIETFRPVKGYEGIYEVSDYGAVRSLNYNKTGQQKYMRNKKDRYGYERICLCRDGKTKYFFIHRLVWEAFVGPIPEGMEIDHINTIRDDNRLLNLRVVTRKENHANPITLVRKRETNQRLAKDPKWREAVREANQQKSKDPKWIEANRKSHSKPVLQLDKSTGEVIREWECQRDIEREIGIDHSKISKCCRCKRNSAGGFKWKFAD